MQTVENGLFISIDYTWKLENGEIFDTNLQGRPLEIEMGQGHVIPGFEEALRGMSLNEKKVFTVQPEDGYGQRNEEYMHTFAMAELPPGIDPEVGQALALTTPDGRQIPAWITARDDQGVTVDMNHPLAGRALTFSIEVTGISRTPVHGSGCGCGCGSDDSHGCH
jgi:peptidylprolyl isomerase